IKVDVCLLGDDAGLGGSYVLSLGAAGGESHRSDERNSDEVLSVCGFYCVVPVVEQEVTEGTEKTEISLFGLRYLCLLLLNQDFQFCVDRTRLGRMRPAV